MIALCNSCQCKDTIVQHVGLWQELEYVYDENDLARTHVCVDLLSSF